MLPRGQRQIFRLAVGLLRLAKDIRVLAYVPLQVLACIVGLVGGNHLPLLAEHHARQVRAPERGCAEGSVDSGDKVRLRAVLQFKVDGGLFRLREVLQCFHGLVVGHHLHAAHVLVLHTLSRQTVATLQQVLPLDVELIDGRAVVGYLPILSHLYARHLFQHVTNRAVTIFGKSRHLIDQGIAPLSYLLGLDGHLL